MSVQWGKLTDDIARSKLLQGGLFSVARDTRNPHLPLLNDIDFVPWCVHVHQDSPRLMRFLVEDLGQRFQALPGHAAEKRGRLKPCDAFFQTGHGE